MIKSKYIELICIFFSIVAVGITLAFSSPTAVEAFATETTYLYENKLFDDSKVHSIDIVIDEKDWNSTLENPLDKEYVSCNLVIDGELYKNIAIRTKGNTSLSSVASSESDRYSLKVEFDHYDNGKTYYGLDKLALNNIIQDSTYLKDYLSYHMMNEIGTASPLSSFVNITVNGEDFGLYLAVEGIEESFVSRNFGSENGKLYKPDSMQMGNNQGNKGTRDNSASLKYTDDDLDSYNTIWDGAIFDINNSDKERVIEALKNLNAGEELESAVDVEAVLKYFAAHNFVLNFDSYTGNMLHNYYLYEANGQLSMIPWDYNLAFGSFGGMGNRNGEANETSATSSSTGMVNFPIDTPISGATLEDRPMLGKLLENEEYMNLYHQYFDEFISEYFESGKFEEEYDKVVTLISPYVEKDTTSFTTYDSFFKGVESLKEFCLLRAESIRGQLDGTIPSTTEGQSKDSSTLVNAEHISISDTGSMGMGGGMGGGKAFNREQTSMETQPQQTEQIQGIEGSESSEEISALSSQTGVELTALAISQQDETIAGSGEDNAMGTPPGNDTVLMDNPTETEVNNAGGEISNAVEETTADSIQGEEVGDQVEGVRPEWNEGMQMPQGQGGGPGNFGNGMNGVETATEETSNTETIILLGASMLVLLFGFMFVLRYKKF